MIRSRRPSRAGLVLGVLIIWALALPSAGKHGFTLDLRPPIALFAIVGLFAFFGLAGRPMWSWLRRTIAVLLVILTGIQFAAGAVEQILDRPLDLYFDLGHVPDLIGLYVDAAGWRGIAVVVGAVLAFVLILALVGRALAGIERAMARPHLAMGSLLVSLVGLALVAVPLARRDFVNVGMVTETTRQAVSAWRAFAVLHGFDARYDKALAASQKPLGPLPGLKAHDVYLIYVESYGTVVLDQPPYRAVVGPALDSFAAKVKRAGYHLLSSRVASPTFGGGSWLAHGTIATGLKLDAVLNELVLHSDRKSLPRYMSAAGYRTVDVMPGIKKPYPEDSFWGFDGHYYGATLGYSGPPFGWFGIPDQYTLREFSARELKPDHAPLFAEIVLVSSHTPFAPVPPYLADWSDAGKFATVPHAEWKRIYAQPNWSNLDQPYLQSIVYDFKTLGAWLARLKGSPLVIILGDHQPPDLTLGAGERWTVPIYVLARDPELVRPFAALGYGAGAEPPRQAHPQGMEKFLGEFLTGFRPRAPEPVSAPRQNPDARTVSRR